MKDRPLKLAGLQPDVLAAIFRATAIYNSRMLWGPMTQPRVPRDIDSARRDIIRRALSRALHDMDPILYRGFAWKVSDRCPIPCNAPHMLAEAIIAELDNARWELTSSKNFGAAEMTPMRASMALYDMLFFVFDFGERQQYAKMGDPDFAIAHKAREFTIDRILETFAIDHAVLSQRPKR